MEKSEVNISEYWNVVWRRKWMAAAFALVVIAVVAFNTFTSRPMYTAKGTLLIEKEPTILTFEEIFKIETFSDDYYQTQYKMLQSRTLAENVVERLKLYEKEEFVGKPKNKKNSMDKSNPALRQSLASAFLARVDVKPVRLTRLVEINFRAYDPKLAADGVNTLFDTFIDMNIETKYEATEQATEFLTNQISGLRVEIAQKEKELQAYGVEKNIIALSDKETTIIDKLGELNRALTEAQIDRVRKEAYYNMIKDASPDYVPEALINPLIQRLREDYVKLSREYTKKQETFRPDYPEMQRLKTELESAKDSLKNETQNLIKGAYSEYQATLQKEKSMQEVFNRQKEEAFQMNSNAILYNSLKIEIENRKNLLQSLMTRQSETGVSARLKGLRTSNVRIVDKADVPSSPSSPNKSRNMILALLVGLMGGVGLAFLFEYLDDSVKNAWDIEKYAALPTLGVVPTFSLDRFSRGNGYGYGYGHRKKSGRSSSAKNLPGLPVEDRASSAATQSGSEEASLLDSSPAKDGEEGKEVQLKSIELITHFAPKSNFSESYRSIRTSLLLSSAEPNLKAIVVSSPTTAEGKTATVANLAVTLAQMEKKVLIIDSDLRKPKQHRIFKVKNINGLTNYLAADIDLKELIKQTRIPNLYLINSGPIPPNPAELLVSEKMAKLIKDLKQQFNYILFDTPPILAVSDALVLGPMIDGMILIVWGEKTSREALKRAKEKLDMLKIKTLGAIINNLNIHRSGYYYKYYHYYNYHYYGEQ